MIAQIPEIPWNVTFFVLLGLIGILAVVALVFTVLLQGKKLFGKNPPVHEEIRAIRAEFSAALKDMANKTRISVKGAYNEIEKESEKREEGFRELNLDRERKWLQLTNEIKTLGNKLSFFEGKHSK